MLENESVAEVIAKLDVFERTLIDLTMQIREYRYQLFAAIQADSLDQEVEGLVD